MLLVGFGSWVKAVIRRQLTALQSESVYHRLVVETTSYLKVVRPSSLRYIYYSVSETWTEMLKQPCAQLHTDVLIGTLSNRRLPLNMNQEVYKVTERATATHLISSSPLGTMFTSVSITTYPPL